MDRPAHRPAPRHDDELELEAPPPEVAPAEPDEPEPEPAPVTKSIDETWLENYREQVGQGRYSVRELMIATSVGAALLGFSQLLPPSIAAAVIGLIVLLGLAVVSQSGPSPLLSLTWWVMLAVYILLSLGAALGWR